MARNVPDLALFLDTMAGFCPHDAMTFDAPAMSFSAAVANPSAPKRIAWTPDLGGICEVDREIREVTSKMVRRFEEIGCVIDEVSPDFGPVDEVFMVLRSQQFVVDRERTSSSIATRSSRTSSGHRTRPEAERQPARLGRTRARRVVQANGRFFQTYDLL